MMHYQMITWEQKCKKNSRFEDASVIKYLRLIGAFVDRIINKVGERMKKIVMVVFGVMVSSIALVVVLLNFVDNQTQENPETIRFTWWGNSDRNDAYIAAIRKFERANPEVKIDYEYYPWEDYFENLFSMEASEHLPDVFQMDIMYLSELNQLGELADLQPYIDNGALDSKDISNQILESGRIDDKLVGYTATINAIALIVNSKLVEDAGESLLEGEYSFDDWVAQMIRITEKTGNISYVDNGDVYVPLQYYLQTLGQSLVAQKENKSVIGFTDEAFLHFFDSFQILAKAGGIATPNEVASYKSMGENPLVNGKGIFQLNWAQMVDRISGAAIKNGQNLRITKPFSASNQGELTLHPGIQFSVSKHSGVKKSAIKFLDFLVNDQSIAVDYFGIERGLPANKKVLKKVLPTLSDNDRNVASYVTEVKMNPQSNNQIPPNGMPQMYQLLNELFNQCVSDEITSEEALSIYKDSFNETIGGGI